METAFAQPARQVLRAHWLPFLHFSVDHWPSVADAATQIECFRAMVEETPRITDVEVAEIEALLERQPETVEDGRLLSLLSFVCNFVWLEADNPFLSSVESSSASSSCDEVLEPDEEADSEAYSPDNTPDSASSSLSKHEDDDSSEEGDDERLFYIKEIVLCKNTLAPMKAILAKPLWRLFEREQGVTEDNLHLFKNLLKQNLAYLENGTVDSLLQQQLLAVEDSTPLKRRKLS